MEPALLVARRPVRSRVGVGAAIVLVLVGLGIAVLVSAFGSHGTTQSITPSTASPSPGATSGARSGAGPTIYLHILGAVAKPGLYLLTDGDRAVDLVAAAGGFTDTADRSALNLARPLVDGEQVVVPHIGEVPAAAAPARQFERDDAPRSPCAGGAGGQRRPAPRADRRLSR